MADMSQEFDWDAYRNSADKYLARKEFKGTPITGDMMMNSAKNSYMKHGVIVPLNLALSQGQFETKFGTDSSGRPNYRNNPFNVGEYDKKTVYKPKNTEEGIGRYFDLMAQDYLSDKDSDTLLKNFVNKKGYRYASDTEYEKKIGTQIKYINRYLAKDTQVKASPVSSHTNRSFAEAFAEARKDGATGFEYNGKSYNTRVK